MSARKLYSQVVKSSNSSFLFRRKHYTNSSVFTPVLKPAQLAVRVIQTADYSQALGSLTKDQAHDLVFRMNDEERVILMRTLEQFNVSKEKDGLECKSVERDSIFTLMLCFINQPDECLHLTRRFHLLSSYHPPPPSLSLFLSNSFFCRKLFHARKR